MLASVRRGHSTNRTLNSNSKQLSLTLAVKFLDSFIWSYWVQYAYVKYEFILRYEARANALRASSLFAQRGYWHTSWHLHHEYVLLIFIQLEKTDNLTQCRVLIYGSDTVVTQVLTLWGSTKPFPLCRNLDNGASAARNWVSPKPVSIHSFKSIKPLFMLKELEIHLFLFWLGDNWLLVGLGVNRPWVLKNCYQFLLLDAFSCCYPKT